MRIGKIPFLSALLLTFLAGSLRATPTLVYPKNHQNVCDSTVMFVWDASIGDSSYDLEISTDPTFASGNIEFPGIVVDSTPVSSMIFGSFYYWHVRTHANSTISPWSIVDTIAYFIPPDFSGPDSTLSLWLTADRNVIKDAGNNVIDWVTSGNDGDTLAQTSAANRPVWVDSVLFNRAMVHFNGSNEYLVAPGTALNIGSNSVSQFLVGKAINDYTPNTSYSYFAKSEYAAAPSCYGLINISSTIYNVLVDYNSKSHNATYSPFSDSNFIAFESVVDRSAGSNTLYADDDQLAEATGISAASSSITSPYNFYVGTYDNPTGNGVESSLDLNGYIGEVVFYNQAFNDSVRMMVSKYLMDKFSPPVNLGPNKILNNFCADTLKAAAGYTFYTWSTGASGANINSIVVTSPGTYSITATDVFMRTSVDTILVIEPNPNFTGPNDKICFGDTVIWNTGLDTPTFTFHWSDNSTKPYLDISNPGTYSVTVTGPGGCTLASKAVTFAVDSFKLETSLGSVHSFCTGNLLELQQGAGLVSSYLWSTGSTLPYISIDSAGLYGVRLTDGFGCVALDTINITIKGVGPVSNFKTDTVCVGAVTQFTDLSTIENPYSITAWLWQFGDGSPTSSQQNPTHVFPAAGIYNDTLTTTANTGCISTPITHQVLVRPTVEALFNDSLGCIFDSTRFFDSSIPAPGDSVISWFWNFGGGGGTSKIENPKYEFSGTGKDTVSLAVTTELGCRDTFTRTVNVISSTAPPDSFALLAPINYSNLVDAEDTFAWQISANAVRYVIQVSTNPQFSHIIYSQEVYSPKDSTVAFPLNPNFYYWRVIAFDLCGDSLVSLVDSFTQFNPTYYLGTGYNPSFWVMADGPLIKNSNNRVTQWTDQSRNTPPNNVTQDSLTPAYAPTWQGFSIPQLNNRPVLHFDGTDSLTGGNILNMSTKSRTIFVVGQSISANGTYVAKSYYGAANKGAYGLLWIQDLGDALSDAWNDGTHSFIDTVNTGILSRYELAGFIADRDNSIMTIFRNSHDGGNVEPIAGSSIDMECNFNFLVGGYGWGANSPNEQTTLLLNGYIAEIIFFDTVLAPQDYLNVRRYLYLKYGGGPVYLGPNITVPYGFCQQITLDASDRYYHYLWSNGDTTQTIRTTLGGAYSVTVTDVFDQVWSDTIHINRPGIHFPGDTIFCLGDSINLNVNLGPAYHYLFSTGDTVPSIYISTPGKYWVTITDTISPANGGPCFLSDTINVRVDSFRVLATLGPDTTVCRGQYIGLQTEASTAAYYHWSDGSSGDTLVVDSSGTYSVTVTSVNGCVANSSIYVNTSGALANVAFDVNSAYCIGDTVDFLDQTTIVPPYQILYYQWAFGDDSTDTTASPDHYYAQPGTYKVTLTVGADSGCVRSLSQTLVVNPLPNDSFTYRIGCADALMDFRNEGFSSFADPTKHWLWNFGDGIGTDTFTNPQYAYAQPGLYPVTLKVTTLTGCQQTVTDTVQVFPQLVVKIGADNLCEGQSVQFYDASPGFSDVAWLWQFPDNTSATDSNPVKSFNPTGQYVIMLSVENAIGCVVVDTDTITIYDPPVANFDDPDGCVQFAYQFSDLSTSPPGDSLQSRVWNFGDSSAVSIKHRPAHLYADTGVYNVTLTVTTEHGCQDSITLPVDILGPPKAAFSFTPNFGGAPININFTDHSIGASSYLWVFGDGATSTDENPSHTYTQDGNYLVHLITYNSVGCSDTASDTVNVVQASLDLAILHTNITQDSAGEYNMCAFIVNVGTRAVYNFDIIASLGGGSTIIEHVADTLYTGDTLTYCFHSHYFSTVPVNQTYICIYTENPDSGVDVNPANNIICTTLQNDIRIIPPYPNPADNELTFGVVLPSNEPLTVLLYDELGRNLGTVFSGTGSKGLNQWNVNLQPYSNAGYFFRVIYMQEVFTVQFVIAR